MNTDILVNLLFSLVPIALFLVAISFGLKRQGYQLSQKVKNKRTVAANLKKGSMKEFARMNEKNDRLQILREEEKSECDSVKAIYESRAAVDSSTDALEGVISENEELINELEGLENSDIEKTLKMAKASIHSAKRQSPYQFSSNGSGSLVIALLAVGLSGCGESGGKFVNETAIIDFSASYVSPSGSSSPLEVLTMPSDQELDYNRYELKLTVINDRRVQEYYKDSLGYPEDFLDRVEQKRIANQRNYTSRVMNKGQSFLSSINQRAGQSYIFEAIKSNANELARSKADIKRIHVWSDMLPHSPAFDVSDFVHRPKAILENGNDDKIIAQIDEYLYEEPYEDWNGVEILIHYNPSKEEDEIYAAIKMLFQKWVTGHGGSISFLVY